MPKVEAILQLEKIRWRPQRSVKQVMLASDIDEVALWDFCRMRLETSLRSMGLGDFADDAFQETYAYFRTKLPDSVSFESVRGFAHYFRKSGVYVAYRLVAKSKKLSTSVDELIHSYTNEENSVDELTFGSDDDEQTITNKLCERLQPIFDRMEEHLNAKSLSELAHHFRDRHHRSLPWPRFPLEPRAKNEATQRTLRRRGMQQVYRWFEEGIFDRDLERTITFLFTGKISHD